MESAMASTRRVRAGQVKSAEPADYPAVPTPLLLLFLGFVIFVYLQGGYRIPVLGDLRFEFIVGQILLVAAVAMNLRNGRLRASFRSGRSTFWWSVALLLMMLVFVPVASVPTKAWETFVDRCLKFAIFGYLVSSFVVNPTALRWFFVTYIAAFMKMGQEGITGYITGSLVWENQGTPRLNGPTPSYAHPNSFAGTQLSTVPFIFHFWKLASRWGRLALAFAGGAALLVTMASGSRTAYVGVIVWGLFMFSRSRAKGRALLVMIGLLFIAPLVVPPAYVARFETIFTQKDAEGASIDARKEILRDAIAIATDHPFGVGLDSFVAARTAAFGRTQDTHNTYLQVFTNFGVLGFLVFIGFVVSVCRTLWRSEKRSQRLVDDLRNLRSSRAGETGVIDEHIRDAELVRAASAGILGFIIIRLALGAFGHDLYERYWWFAAGFAIALARMIDIAEAKAQTTFGAVADANGNRPARAPRQ